MKLIRVEKAAPILEVSIPRVYELVRAPDEHTIIRNHHPAYISEEEFAEIQRVLATNALAKARRNLGPGTALLQGIVRCAAHGRAMAAYYHSRKQKLRPSTVTFVVGTI